MLTASLNHAVMITGFVALMMLLIDYLNVLSRGGWQERIRNHPYAQYLVCSFLGATPGCMGAFAVVSLYVHRVVSIGALLATMIATSGDASFVMLASFPRTAIFIFGLLFLIAIPVGVLVDLLWKRGSVRGQESPHAEMELHPEELERCNCIAHGQIIHQWLHCSFHRAVLTFLLGTFLYGVFLGRIGPGVWNWMRITLAVSTGLALAIVFTAPDHFLVEHLWNHIVKKHILRVFLWILGTLIVMHLLLDHLNLEETIRNSGLAVLFLACAIGLIPDSGPHIIFVTFFAQGLIPFSILLASSIVQDGHGMLPVLAHSRRTFLGVKSVNFAIGLAIGLLGYLMGW